MGIAGTYFNMIKAICDKPTANIIPAEIMNKTRMSTLATTTQHSFGSPSHGNQRRKRNKRNPSWKGRSKIADDMIQYLENPKDTTRKLLELINESDKVAGYKINTLKLHFYILTMKAQIKKLGKQSNLPSYQIA